jgi:hypothetical protein
MYRLNAITRAIPRTFLGNNRITVRAAKISNPLTYQGKIIEYKNFFF